MPSRRDQIRMTPDEIDEFLAGRHTMSIATHSPDGTIHLVAMWYGFLGGRPAIETFAKSQKVRNLQRDPRFTALVETGADYGELRGVQLVGTAVVHDDEETVLAACRDVTRRYAGITDPDELEAAAAMVARKRVAVELIPDRVVSWDHRKLAGGY